MTDEAYKRKEENKVEKSLRNSEAFQKALARAMKGDFDEDLECATNMDLLKITEKWSIREIFNLETGDTYFKLYKEVYYVADPHKYYFETVEQTIFRRIAGQKEQGDKEWAKKIAAEYGCAITYREKQATKQAKKIDVVTATDKQ